MADTEASIEVTKSDDIDSKPEEDETVEPGEWQSEKYRAKVVERIEEEIAKTESQVPKSAADLEEFAFTKAKSRKNYHDLVARVLIYVAEFNMKKSKNGQEEAQEDDPKEKEVAKKDS